MINESFYFRKTTQTLKMIFQIIITVIRVAFMYVQSFNNKSIFPSFIVC